MADVSEASPQTRVIGVVQRLLADRSIVRTVQPDDDLREAGLSSLDMVSLVLSVEAEFDVLVPEQSITPAQFRSVSAISVLVAELLQRR
jgi:acyl carrier protein